MHYKIGVTCVPGIQWTHVLYLVVITRQSNPPISQVCVMNSQVSRSNCSHAIATN